MVGIYLFLAHAFSNTSSSVLSYSIQYPLIQHISQPIQISLTVSNNSPDTQLVTNDVWTQLSQIICNEKTILPNNQPHLPVKLQEHQKYSWDITYSPTENCSKDKLVIKHMMNEVKFDVPSQEITIIDDVSPKVYWKQREGNYYIFAPDGKLVHQIEEEPQYLTFGYDVLGIQTKTRFEGCIIDQSIKCYTLARPAEDFLLLDGNILYENSPAIIIKQSTKVSLLVFDTPVPYFVPMASYIPKKTLSLENQGNLFWIFYGTMGLDILRPSRSNIPNHPMSGTRLMKENILYADITRKESLYIEVVYIVGGEIRYQQMTLHGKSSSEQGLMTSTVHPTDVNIENDEVRMFFPDTSIQSIELKRE